MAIAYLADRINTGEGWLYDHAIVVQDGVVSNIVPIDELNISHQVLRYTDCFIAPAFIDLQIYGAYNKLLAVYPTADSLHKLYDYCRSGGAHYFLPTVATNTYQTICNCIDAIKDYWKQDGKGVPGLHVEGPWINKVKRGAHVESLIHSPTIKQARELLEYGKGVIKIITLAPEVCSDEVLELIRSYNVIISAGHSNASYSEATTAFNNGIPVATHLFNAMSPLQHREPGIVGAVLNHNTAMCSIIADGFHVDFAALSIAHKIMGDRLFLITDAVTKTNEGFYKHELEGDKYVSDGILSGSAITMIKSVRNCVQHAAIELEEALRMASLYPAKVLGIDQSFGKIEKGFEASFVVLNNDLELMENI